MIINMVTTFHMALRRIIAGFMTTALLWQPVAGQCLGSASAHADMATPDTPAIQLMEPSLQGHMDHEAGQHPGASQPGDASTADSSPSDCCDNFTCDMSGCASLASGHVTAVSLPELLKNATIFARASMGAAASQPPVLFKPPIYS
jgi:hypothetical protein